MALPSIPIYAPPFYVFTFFSVLYVFCPYLWCIFLFPGCFCLFDCFFVYTVLSCFFLILPSAPRTRFFHAYDGGQVSPFLIPALISNTASGVVAIEHKARGPNFGVVSACATGTHAIGTAMDFMLRGEVRLVSFDRPSVFFCGRWFVCALVLFRCRVTLACLLGYFLRLFYGICCLGCWGTTARRVVINFVTLSSGISDPNTNALPALTPPTPQHLKHTTTKTPPTLPTQLECISAYTRY